MFSRAFCLSDSFETLMAQENIMNEKVKILYNLKAFFEKEKETRKPWHLNNILQRMKAATGLPSSTISRIVNRETKPKVQYFYF
jgi:DNA-directed RNA polymerase specialized sigma54-like protein